MMQKEINLETYIQKNVNNKNQPEYYSFRSKFTKVAPPTKKPF